MNQQELETFTLCMNVIDAPDVGLAFNRMYLFSYTLRLRVEQTTTGGFVVKALETKNTEPRTLSDKNYIETVRNAYNQKKDELTQRALSNFLCRS